VREKREREREREREGERGGEIDGWMKQWVERRYKLNTKIWNQEARDTYTFYIKFWEIIERED